VGAEKIVGCASLVASDPEPDPQGKVVVEDYDNVVGMAQMG
jgi:hypothetical protein